MPRGAVKVTRCRLHSGLPRPAQHATHPMHCLFFKH